MAGFLKSLFGRGTAPTNGSPPLPPIEEMSFEQILAQIHTLVGAPSARLASSLVRRLYEIAFYEHHVPTAHRTRACQVLQALKSDLEKSLADNPDAIEALRLANSHMENNVRYSGIGSLAWMLGEDKVPADEIIQYVMRPEHGHLLADLLETLEPTAVEIMRPELVRHLILSRRDHDSFNSVLILHGLAAKADKATCAIFNAKDRSALLGVPDDYSAGRAILVNLGLLPSDSKARPFAAAVSTDSLVALMASVWKQRDASAQSDLRIETETDERRTVALMALSMIRSHLTRRMLGQIYGSEVSAAVLAIHTLDSSRNTLEMFDLMADKLAAIDPTPPIDFMLFRHVMELGGLAPETEEDFENGRKWLELGEDWLNHERVELQEYLRFILRWMSDADVPEIRSMADTEIAEFIRELYVRKGAHAGIAEKTLVHFEDWIGTDA